MDHSQTSPAAAPTTRLLWQANVSIGARQDLGMGPYGARGIIPILGGRFVGGAGFESLRGVILPGGADRQVLRADGAKELDALYEMQIDDGTILTIRNRVVIDEPTPGARYALSHVQVTAPKGPWSWLGRRMIVGTLESAQPSRAAVLIRAWLVEPGLA